MGTEGRMDFGTPTPLPHSRHNDGTLLCRVRLGPQHYETGMVAPCSLQPAPATSAQSLRSILMANGNAVAPDGGDFYHRAGGPSLRSAAQTVQPLETYP